MSILSTSSRLIKVGQDYSAGSGISIDNHVISVTSVPGTTYSAGDNITIEDNVINSKDWSQDIADASANAYNEATAQIDNKLDSTAFTAWQSGQYATDLQTIEGQISNKLDTSSFSDVSASFLTAINIPESATWNEVSHVYEQASGTYLTSHQSLDGYATENWVTGQGYITGVDIPESAVWQDVSTTVQSNSAQWSDNTGDEEVNSFVYDNSATINEVDTTYQTNSASYLTAHQDLSDYQTIAGMTAYQEVGDYYSASNPSGFITGVDLSPYYTTADANTLSSMLSGAIDYVSANAGDEFPVSADEAIQYIQTNSATIDDVNTSYQTNSGNFLTAHQDISNKLDTTAFSTVSGDFLTAHQSLDGYATENWVTAQGYITGVDLSEYAKTSSVLDYIDSACSSKLDTTSFSNVSGDFLTTSFGISESAHWEEATNAYEQNSGTYLTSHQDLSDYQTIEGMTAYQPVGNYYSASNPSGFITGVDLSPYYTTAEANSLSSMLSGAIDYVSANAGDEFPASANEAITAYQTNSGNYLTAISIPESATWNDVSTTVQTNSAQWGQGGGGSVTSPSGTIIVNGSNIESTNSAVGTIVTPSASALLGNDVNINGPWASPSVFNFTLPAAGGTLYAVRDIWYGTDYLNFSGKASNGDITTGTITVGGNPGTYTADLNEIVSDLSAQGTQSNVIMEHFYVTSPSASNSGVYELAWKKDVPTGQFFTGYNTFTSGSTSYSAVIDTDYKLTAGNATYSLIGAYTNANNKFNKLTGSNTLFEYSGYYEMGNIAYKPDIIGLSGATDFYNYPDSFYFRFDLAQYPLITAKLDTVYLTFEATQSGTVISTGWNLYNHSGNEYTFVRYLKPTDAARESYEYSFYFNYGSWGTITNATASATVYSAIGIKELAFKDDLTAYQPVGSYATTNELEQVSADITATIPSTAGLASESYVQTNSAILTGMIDGKQDTLTFGYDGQDKISSINNSGIAGGSFDVMPISGTGSVNVYEQTNVLWVSGKDFTSDISYISGTIGDVETLLASL